MKTGLIYKIWHPGYPDKFYIGQTRQPSVSRRWAQHKRDAKKWLENENNEGKDAKFHEAIKILREKKWKKIVLESHHHEIKNGLINKLNERENHFIDHYNSIEKGWNKVKASTKILPLTKDSEKEYTIDGVKYTYNSRVDIANNHDISYTSLSNRINNKGEDISSAVKHLLGNKSNPKLEYVYKRHPPFASISEVEKSTFNKDKIPLKGKIRTLKESGKLEIKRDDVRNVINIILIPEVFEKPDGPFEITGPDGVKHGPVKKKTELREIVAKAYSDQHIPVHSVINQRLRDNWSIEQAYGFDPPPNIYDEANDLVKTKGYKYVPPWDASLENKGDYSMGKPVILEETKEVFLSQKVFADTYGGKEDEISRLLKKGLRPYEVLKKKGLIG